MKKSPFDERAGWNNLLRDLCAWCVYFFLELKNSRLRETCVAGYFFNRITV